MFTNTFLKLGSVVINEAAIVSVDLDYTEHQKDPKAEPWRGVAVWLVGTDPENCLFFAGRDADQLRRLFNSDPAVWAQREGPGWCGVLDLTPEGP